MAVDVFAVAPALPGPVRSLQALDVDSQVIHGDLDRHALLHLRVRHAFDGAVDVILHGVLVPMHLTLQFPQFLNYSLERLDHCVPLHRAGCVQNLEVVGHSVLAVLMLFNELLYLRQLSLHMLVLLAHSLGETVVNIIVVLPSDVCRLDSAHPMHQVVDGRLVQQGALLDLTEVGHMLQLR